MTRAIRFGIARLRFTLRKIQLFVKHTHSPIDKYFDELTIVHTFENEF